MEKKDEYIFIKSIEEIDPKKLTIRDLNKKFIDENGRKYALKFDLKTKKIEFIRIASSYIEAQKIKQEILKAKHQNFYEVPNFIHKESSKIINEKDNFEKKESEILYDFSRNEQEHIDENRFFQELEKETKKCIDSLKAIEKNLNRSYFSEKASLDTNELFDLLKDIENQCYQQHEEAIKFLKEIVYFPRTLNYYLAKIPGSLLKKIQNLDTKDQLEFIKINEIQRIFQQFLLNLLNYTKKLENYFYKIPPVERERKPLVDLIPSFTEIKEICESLLKKLNQWYTTSSNKFS